ncbi:MAG: radical SAM protein [Candidatus Shapirobacteria bacterium]|nr:radical SAM protein [Candidatus Shapirobacteria bacterium]
MSKNKPLILFIRITENCNASCFMCGFAQSKKQFYVTLEQFKDIVDKAYEAGIKMVRFTGGEPLLHPNIVDFVQLFKEKNIKTSIISNGFLLPEKYENLISNGLDQLVLSLDGSKAELHDNLRNLPGAFDNLTGSIKKIKSIQNNFLIRINTVVSPLNINDLENILKLLIDLDVDQWSIIPIKSKENIWEKVEKKEFLKIYSRFQKNIKNISRPKLLGYSKKWAGRSKKDVEKYLNTGISSTPKAECKLVGLVRFYVPSIDKLSPCNCASWRLSDVDFDTHFELSDLTGNKITKMIDYLRINGPKVCKGCEPINAFLAENPEIIDDEIFSF